MESDEVSDAPNLLRGGAPSIVRSFSIEGLYGYRSVAMSSEYAATILIAKNGSGKTTLLGALDAFLRMEFSRLRDLPFSYIRCLLRGDEEELILHHDDVLSFLKTAPTRLTLDASHRFGIEPDVMFRFLTESWPRLKRTRQYLYDYDTFVKVARGLEYSTQGAVDFLDNLSADIYSRTPKVLHIKEALERSLKDIDIVYLPTYRRVELALSPELNEPRSRRRRPQLKVAVGSLYKADIEFGLGDIEERLRELNRDIILESNNGYAKISANIINELIDGSFDRADPDPSKNPSIDELNLFFSRLKSAPRAGGFAETAIINIDNIYNIEQEMSVTSKKFLDFFLQKLRAVIEATNAIEEPVEGFVEGCNKYLGSPEVSTVINRGDLHPRQFTSDNKKMLLSRKNLRVRVQSTIGKKKIPMDSLSSGEKQMVSLFAKLYLYPGEKLVLIDEPELSLSIEWQRQILPDIMNSPRCGQIIAITHSPFVFENELEPFARSLKLGIDLSALPESDGSEPLDYIDG